MACAVLGEELEACMTRQLMRSVLAALVLNSALVAQEKPDFTGTWQMDVRQSETVAQAVPSPASTVIITKTPSVLRIETRAGGNTKVEMFPLENEDNPRPVGSSGSSDVQLSWDGDTLVTTSTETVNGKALTRTKRRTLDSTGKIMTVETTLVVPHAYSTSTSRDVFRKSE
jgi:hypothetical protein